MPTDRVHRCSCRSEEGGATAGDSAAGGDMNGSEL